MNFKIWLQVCRLKLSLLRSLSSIITCLRTSFYIGALFNPFQILHHCCPHLHTLHLPMLHNVHLLDLMAATPLLIEVGEEEVGGDVLAVTTTNIIVSLTVEIVGASFSRIPVTMIATSSSRSQQGRTSGHNRLDANFPASLDTLHNNVLSLCIMGIKLRPTSPLVMLQQQILSLGFLTRMRINMLL